MPTALTPQSIADIQDSVRTQSNLLLRSGGSKIALSSLQSNSPILNLRALSGILEYQPGEYTFTAQAATPLTEVQAALAEHGQYMPFDPPLAARGATLGGTIAAGLSGSGRYRYGGVRDFLIGVRFVDGHGQLVRGGGKVVKNAAGFDLPKLLVGSLGRLGVLVEVSFKVFPRPKTYATLQVAYPSLADGVAAIHKLAAAPFDMDALDLAPNGDGGATLWVRQGGLETVLTQRTDELKAFLLSDAAHETTRLEGSADIGHWEAASNFTWVPDSHALVKVATTPGRIVALHEALASNNASVRYCVGGNLTWIAWPNAIDDLHHILLTLGLSGLTVIGPVGRQLIGAQKGQAFAARIKHALDPDDRFLPIEES